MEINSFNFLTLEKELEKINLELQKMNDRLHRLEEKEIIRESKMFVFKQGLKYWPLLVLIIVAVDYKKVWSSLLHSVHLN